MRIPGQEPNLNKESKEGRFTDFEKKVITTVIERIKSGVWISEYSGRVYTNYGMSVDADHPDAARFPTGPLFVKIVNELDPSKKLNTALGWMHVSRGAEKFAKELVKVIGDKKDMTTEQILNIKKQEELIQLL